ncbi:YggS family pyridoxal phosphate-dependent enzyme [Kangiella koreensis]|uniref:Pyridoxal phosphate homeostasis protein n=1 Tax=Kangiella koreensis (strain DSM 16069 / JCM 12317 / KCTC 12182 / SW-125) TaxID=523791 RepID=C7R6X2_KANKD|nr:YggS family pyridoxal phosphate-dependent enzyme [Kangiella koreensis]ACV25638.1 alanine racemase domain protein [Kangiella koreensis DSM 16069]
MSRIASHLADLQLQIVKTCAKRRIFKHNVLFVAVSKRHPADSIREAYAAGHRDFGENQVQEALDKISQLSDLNINWHMIGVIQSRKCKDIAQHFDWVQSVDRLKVAQKLNQHREQDQSPLNVLIQVNLFGESQKAGVNAAECKKLAHEIMQLPRLKLRGLMALPPKQTDPQTQFQQFERIHSVYQELQAEYPQLDTLSMGMSGDYEPAILAGSTMIRLGTAIFGERD